MGISSFMHCIGIVICLILGQVIKRSEGFPKRTIAVELGNIVDMTAGRNHILHGAWMTLS